MKVREASRKMNIYLLKQLACFGRFESYPRKFRGKHVSTINYNQ